MGGSLGITVCDQIEMHVYMLVYPKLYVKAGLAMTPFLLSNRGLRLLSFPKTELEPGNLSVPRQTFFRSTIFNVYLFLFYSVKKIFLFPFVFHTKIIVSNISNSFVVRSYWKLLFLYGVICCI